MLDREEEETSRCDGSLLTSSTHLVPLLGMVTVHIIYGTYSVLAGGILAAGIDPLFLVYSLGVATFVYIAPFAACWERRKWPEKVGWKLMAHIVLISLGGVTAFQVLVLIGLQRTSPAIASAMSNLSPGLIFLIACCLRFEQFDAKSRYSIAKATGTLLCLGGVIAMSLLQQGGDATSSSSSPSLKVGVLGAGPNQEWITGCVYLFSAVFIVSCTMVLQAAALKDLPAPLSLTAITSLMGALFTAAIQLFTKGKLDLGNYSISTTLLATYVVLSSAVTSACVAFQTWCIRKQGPVFVSMFSPIGTVTSAILSAVVLGKFLTLGGLAGVLVMIIGLYTVLWAKRNECPLPMLVDGDGNDHDDVEQSVVNNSNLKKPLLR